MHAARVVHELQRRHPGLTVFGVGGKALESVGARLVANIRELSIMGFSETVRAVPRVLSLKKRVAAAVEREKPDCALLVDSADFNLRLAVDLKRLNVPIAYYIAPKLWASRPGRARLLIERVDRLGVIFPFEVEFLAGLGVKATYVGNPTVDGLATVLETAPPLPVRSNAGPIIALLPGSRPHEVRRLAPPLSEAMGAIRALHPAAQFLVPRATTIEPHELAVLALAGATLVDEPAPLVVRRADVAVVAAGTATLETALMGVPQLVVYRVGALTAFLWRFILRIPHVSLPNILAQKEVVRELFQAHVTSASIAREVCELLKPERRAQLQAEYDALRGPLGKPGAAVRMANLVEELVAAHQKDAPATR
jgi:lipid-A-disaccharide synthase